MNWDDLHVAVTGAAGFLGSHLCERLTAEGASVVAMDNFEIGSVEYLEEIEGDIDIVDLDIRTMDQNVFEDVDVLYHFAAIANPRTCDDNPDLAYDVNVTGTKNVFAAAAKSGCDRVVFSSSAAVYGEPEETPIDEQHPLNGDDPYSISKKMGEQLADLYHGKYETDISVIRNFNMFGPRQATDYLIPTLVTQALEEDCIEIWTADSVRDFTYVSNTMDALLAVAKSQELAGETVNIGSNVAISSGELAELVSEKLGGVPIKNLEKDSVGSSRLVCDNKKLRETADWTAEVSFEEGLSRTIDWFQSQNV